MPSLEKNTLSQFIRTECLRQLRLNLSPENSTYQHERDDAGMPPVQPPRPGLGHLAQAGRTWEKEKIADLSETFGSSKVLGNRRTNASGEEYFQKINLSDILSDSTENTFLVEVEFEVTNAFKSCMGICEYDIKYDLNYSKLRPDIVEVLSPNTFSRGVLPNGNTFLLSETDERLQLRIIDIKLTAEPSPSYFAEVTYYSMVLAGWLNEKGLQDEYVVVSDAAVWPGSHDASKLVKHSHEIRSRGLTPTHEDLWHAFEEDLEPVPFDVFAGRLKHFFLEDIPLVLSTPWDKLPWHVNNRCKGCDYLGYPWKNAAGEFTHNELHCIPMAERLEHLSRIAFVSRGASTALQEKGILDVTSLAQLSPTDEAFDSHYNLRATRYVVNSRANSLQSLTTKIPDDGGSSSTMPKWADLHIYLTIDFDLGSGISFAMGINGFWMEPFKVELDGDRETKLWHTTNYIVDQKDLDAEKRELLRLLSKINEILDFAKEKDESTKVQFYIWDNVQYQHFTRIIGRHLHSIITERSIADLVWLFPPEQVLPNPQMQTRASPITIVKEVVRTLIAAPIPHYYTLFNVARVYHHDTLLDSIAKFNVHPLFEDSLSDQIPSERAHEIWTRAEHWDERLQILRETINKQLIALSTVTRRLENDLRDTLKQTAPKINISSPERQYGISIDGQLWYGFAKLNAALEELEVNQLLAMPPHEREARFKSAILPKRLVEDEEKTYLASLGLDSIPGRRVYEMNTNSKEAKIREGDFNFALAPRQDGAFLTSNLVQIASGTSIMLNDSNKWKYMKDFTKVTVKAIDRDLGIIVLDTSQFFYPTIDDLEDAGVVDLSTDVILDPTESDFFTKKLHATLHAIGNPQNAKDNSIIRAAVGLTSARKGRTTRSNPAADVLWSANEVSKVEVFRELSSTRDTLEQNNVKLNTSQWVAWELSLHKRLQLIWGPPGTGKSRTLRASVLGAIIDARLQDKPTRILVCGPTYNSIDNVFLDVYSSSLDLGYDDVVFYRLRSSHRGNDENIPYEIDFELNQFNPSQDILDLKERLENKTGITVVGATPQQTHKLLVTGGKSPQQELFDYIIIDEASQMDVGNAILSIASLSEDGGIVIAGDPKQLSPIHKAKAPVGLEAMVGSIFQFFTEMHGLEPAILQENYRSNKSIIELGYEAGYPASLTSYSPDLCLNIINPLHTSRTPPSDWPEYLCWTPELSFMINSENPIMCFTYPEGRSGQWNLFEANAVASIIFLLYGNLGKQLKNECDINGDIIPVTNEACDVESFWKKGVGIVTPHRAQQALIITTLQKIFPDVPQSLIRSSVDTVERFQGQQRDVIVASYSLGDQDAINDEDEFLLSLNRFNVMSSRARAKLITIVSQEVVNHLSHDIDVLRDSRLLKIFIESFCNNSRKVELAYLTPDGPKIIPGSLKWR